MALLSDSIKVMKFTAQNKESEHWLDPSKIDQARKNAQLAINRQVDEYLKPVQYWERLINGYDAHVIQLLEDLSKRYIRGNAYDIEGSGTTLHDMKQQFHKHFETNPTGFQPVTSTENSFTFTFQWVVVATLPSKASDQQYFPQFFRVSVKTTVPRPSFYQMDYPTTIGTITVSTWLDTVAMFGSSGSIDSDVKHIQETFVQTIVSHKIGTIYRRRKGLLGQIWCMSTPKGDLEIH
jgi:hypothetical protein